MTERSKTLKKRNRRLEPKRRYDAIEWRPAFLAALRATGNVRVSANQAGVARNVVYEAKAADPEFAEKWEEALEDALDALEIALRSRALKRSDTAAIFLLKAHRKAVYGEAVKVEVPAVDNAARVVVYVPDNGRNPTPAGPSDGLSDQQR